MTKIPSKIVKEIVADPSHLYCALEGLHGHVCGGRITWEHALIYSGKQIQERWAIISICEKAHAVDEYQDAGTMNKDLNVWVALNQGTEEDFKKFPRAFPSYYAQRERLNKIYGVFEPNLDDRKINYN